MATTPVVAPTSDDIRRAHTKIRGLIQRHVRRPAVAAAATPIGAPEPTPDNGINDQTSAQPKGGSPRLRSEAFRGDRPSRRASPAGQRPDDAATYDDDADNALELHGGRLAAGRAEAARRLVDADLPPLRRPPGRMGPSCHANLVARILGVDRAELCRALDELETVVLTAHGDAERALVRLPDLRRRPPRRIPPPRSVHPPPDGQRMTNDQLHIVVARGPRRRMGRGPLFSSKTTHADAGAAEGMAPTANASTPPELAT